MSPRRTWPPLAPTGPVVVGLAAADPDRRRWRPVTGVVGGLAARAAAGGAPLTTLAVLLGLNTVDEFDKAAFATLSPEIRETFGVSAGAIGLIGALGYLVVFLASYPLAFLADRTRRLTVAVAGATCWGVATLATGVVRGLLVLCLVRAAAGIGQAVNRPTHSSLLADAYPERSLATVYGVYYLGNPIGSALAAGVAGIIAATLFWQASFFVLAVPTLLLVVAARRLREPDRVGTTSTDGPGDGAGDGPDADEQVPFREAFRTILTIRTLRRDYSGAVLVGGAAVVFPFLLASLANDTFGAGPLARGALFTAVTVAGLAGYVVGGRAGDRLFERDPASAQRLIGGSIVGIGVAFALAAAMPNLLLAGVFVLAGGFSNGLYNGPGARITAAVVPPRIRAQGFAAVDVFLVAGITSGLPALLVLDAHGARWGLFALSPLLVVGGLIYWSAARFVVGDIARATGAVEAERARAAARLAGVAPTLLDVRDLTAGYGGPPVIADVSFTLDEGGVLALLGTNGAGKSTLLRAISGTVTPDAGAVLFGGRDLTGFDPELTVGRGIVLVPGGQGTFPGLTVAEHLRLAASAVGLRGAAAAAAVDGAVEPFPRLRERWGSLGGTLSGGEQQQLALACGLVPSPKLLLVDELSLGLAPRVVGELVEVVRRIAADGVAVLLVEQSVNVALTLADEALFMEKGRIRFRGPTAELLERPDLLRSVFLGADPAADAAGRDRHLSSPGRSDGTTVSGGGDDAGQAALEVVGAALGFGGVVALDRVDLAVAPGALVGLIGPNGAGKSTLLDAVSGRVRLDAGSVRLAGRDVTRLAPQARARLGLAHSFQDARLFPALTVREALGLAAARRRDRAAGPATTVVVGDALDRFGLGPYADAFVGELSTGTRRIVELAGVLVRSPAVILLDEPAAGLAQREVEALAPVLVDLARSTGAALVLVEHDVPLVRAVVDDLVVMDAGRVLARGEPAAVLADPAVIEAYLGPDPTAVARSGTR